MSGGRFAVFLINVLVVWALMHAYLFWRVGSVPWVRARLRPRTIWLTALALYLCYPVARFFQSWHIGFPASLLEHVASNWTGVLFLLVCALLVVDLLTAGGYLFRTCAGNIRGWAMLGALALAIPAFVQAIRPPVIVEHNVSLPGLAKEMDGTTVVMISDLHLGYLIGNGWLEDLVARVNDLQPDILIAAGDIIDGNVDRVRPMTKTLAGFKAKLGKLAVTGNHEHYAGADLSTTLLQSAGFTVLRDARTNVTPGLVIAGVDDFTARVQMKSPAPGLAGLISKTEQETVIFISHTPSNVEEAAGAGADLMLSGHTHNGQIWPFTYLVKLRYPHICGSYQIGSMKLLVGRGTGTWGPRMRLWHPGEILKIRLRST